MKKIYIVLTHTGTLLSRIIRQYTKDEFSHVSISLDKDLGKMYSFGRLNPKNPFIGGFVHEYIDKGTFKRFFRTKAKVFSLAVTNEQYKIIEDTINEINSTKEDYKFNVLGLFAAGFHKKIGKENSFYCAEFVKYVLEKSNVKTNLPEIVRPEDFKRIEDLELIYEGLLKLYKYPKKDIKELLKDNVLIHMTQKEEVV